MLRLLSRLRAVLPLLCALVVGGCGPVDLTDAGSAIDGSATVDGGALSDAGPLDGGLLDGGSVVDAGSGDAGFETDGGPAHDAGFDGGATDGGGALDGGGAADASASDAGADAGGADGGAPFDACAEIDCTVSPAAVCLDATRLSAPTATGSCTAGFCDVTTSVTTCPDACVEGACVTRSCGATTCTAPAGQTCVSAQDISLPYEQGTCSGGTCDYAGWVATCSGGCAGTACAPGSWLSHVRDPDRAFWTCTALDPEQRPHIFYYGEMGAWSAVRETVLTATGWETRTIETTAAGGQHHPLDCAIDRTGTAHVLYQDLISTSVRYAQRPRGGSWAVEFVAAGGSRAYALLMRDLIPVAVFGDATGTAVAERTSSGWVEERRATGRPAHAVAAFDSRGEVVIGRTDISSASSGEPTRSEIGLPDASGGWTFEDTPELGWINDMVIDRTTGTIEIALTNLGPSFLDVHTRAADGRWTQAMLASVLGDGRQGELEVEADGTLHVVFVGRCGPSSTFGVCHAIRGPGGYTVSSVGDALRSRSMSMVLDAAGSPHVAGPDDRSVSALLYLRPY